ncbi:MerR-like DNA binding protein [Pseudonocardia sediminis]|uniref:MerR-like DNA binding protein n=1 Tax=Pseudonocardia sediminis TaxID=1397368 RepID=A0A4Q7UZL1_PSEST|nr:MerR family DNA-binding transcriptional regulator [Pseudonocardia sediminis]RZT87582.1 MerR-like DNA binding protein [Pseudonocardia sediminis]
MTTTAETPVTCTAVDAARERLQRQDAGAPAPGERLDIAEVAARTGVTAHTLRYYERIGCSPSSATRAGTAATAPTTSVAWCS